MKSANQDQVRIAGDERILGSSEFVEKTLKSAGEEYERRMRLRSSRVDLAVLIEKVSIAFGIKAPELSGSSKRAEISNARALVGYIATQ